MYSVIHVHVRLQARLLKLDGESLAGRLFEEVSQKMEGFSIQINQQLTFSLEQLSRRFSSRPPVSD